MRKLAVLSIALATLAVAGCRQEVPHQPMKLGAPSVGQPAR